MLKNILAMDSAELAEKSRDIPISEAALYALLGFLIVVVGIAFLILSGNQTLKTDSKLET